MSSWLPSFDKASEAFAKIGGELNELSNKVGGELTQITSKVTSKVSDISESLPIDNELINKLTLRSDDLIREHELLDAQEKRKELVREYLSEILPWETKDESRMILVEKCKEEILALSTEKVTFELPFRLEEGMVMFNETFDEGDDEEEDDDDGEDDESEEEVNFEDGEKGNEGNEGNEGNDDKNNSNASVNESETNEKAEKAEGDSDTNTGAATATATAIDAAAIAASAAKLEKMQPLPLLLEHFDIDTHVGLIERLLSVDDNLVNMHSRLSGKYT